MTIEKIKKCAGEAIDLVDSLESIKQGGYFDFPTIKKNLDNFEDTCKIKWADRNAIENEIKTGANIMPQNQVLGMAKFNTANIWVMSGALNKIRSEF